MKRLILVAIVSLLAVIFVVRAQERGADRAELIPDLMAEINVWRLNSGLEPVVYNPLLEELAIYQANHLVNVPVFPEISQIHAGPSGESPRQRSQYPEFAWQTYGHPELFAFSEIIAIGTIESAMGFWTTSAVHTRTATNPTYREVGIATRQLNSGVLFVVVFGGQPNVLPALPDPDTNTLYLTNERNEWAGDWIGVADEYRLLDTELEPMTNWLEWEPSIDLPDISDDYFYIQYQDGVNRVTYQVFIDPFWTLPPDERAFAISVDEAIAEPVTADEALVDEAIAQLPTSTPTTMPTATQPPSAFATSTPRPTMAPPTPTIFVPTLTPRPIGSVRLEYDENYLTLINNSGVVVDLYGMTLTDGNFTFDVLTWEVPADEINIGALPPNHCLQLGGFNSSNTLNVLPECSFIRSLVTISEDNFFWVEGTFEVMIQNQVIATCSADSNVCEFTLD